MTGGNGACPKPADLTRASRRAVNLSGCHFSTLSGTPTARFRTALAMVVTVISALLGTPFTNFGTKSAVLLSVAAVPSHSSDAQPADLEAFLTAARAVVMARDPGHRVKALFAGNDAFLAGFDARLVGIRPLCHECSPSPTSVRKLRLADSSKRRRRRRGRRPGSPKS